MSWALVIATDVSVVICQFVDFVDLEKVLFWTLEGILCEYSADECVKYVLKVWFYSHPYTGIPKGMGPVEFLQNSTVLRLYACYAVSG